MLLYEDTEFLQQLMFMTMLLQAEAAFSAKDFFRAASFYAKVSYPSLDLAAFMQHEIQTHSWLLFSVDI